jgi:homoprotocatechuate degradation regulator HpaR
MSSVKPSTPDLPRLLRDVLESVLGCFRPVLSEFGLTEQQWRILRTLADESPLEVWQLAAACQMAKPSLTGVLMRMERAGLVTRVRLHSDQRRVAVSPTPRAWDLIATLTPRITAKYVEFGESVGSRVTAKLIHALEQVGSRRRGLEAEVCDAGRAVPRRQGDKL